MKLYYSPGACSLAPHIVACEAGLAIEAIVASTKTHQLADGTDFYSINPLGYVPFWSWTMAKPCAKARSSANTWPTKPQTKA